jgi:hypothetical protein
MGEAAPQRQGAPESSRGDGGSGLGLRVHEGPEIPP